MATSDARIRRNSGVLEKLAHVFPRNSPEYQALRISAFAFAYVILHHEADFDEYVETVHKPLTKQERAKLRKLL
jgi:hypothetical protein